MRSYFRLLPMTITFAVILLFLKAMQGYEAGQDVFGSLFISSVVAQDEKEEEPAKEEEAPAEDAKGDEEGEEEAEKEDDGDLLGGFLEIKQKKLTEEDLLGNQLGGLRPGDRRFSPIELKMLGQLSQRRKDLDKREEELAMKENLLTQTEKRVDEKFQEMETLRAELSEIIVQFKEVEETKIQSLVKIYENMKPKDAARIFDELEMPVLILVIDKMKEKKAAPILAGMDPMKAKRLTVELAEQRKQEDEKSLKDKMINQ